MVQPFLHLAMPVGLPRHAGCLFTQLCVLVGCRCINKANALLMTSGPDGSRRWRVRHAPEDSRLACLGAGAATAGLLLTHLVVLLATLLVLMLLPLAFSCTAVALAALAAVGRPVPQSTLFHAAVRGEMLLSALLVGVLAVHVPPPPYRSVWDF